MARAEFDHPKRTLRPLLSKAVQERMKTVGAAFARVEKNYKSFTTTSREVPKSLNLIVGCGICFRFWVKRWHA